MTNPNQITSDAIIAASTLIESLREDILKLKLELATISSRTTAVEEQSNRLIKIVIEGNGQRALITRVFTLEDSITNIKEEVKQASNNVNTIIHKVELEIEEIQDEQKVKANAVAERGWDIFKQLVPLGIVALITLATTGFFASNISENTKNISEDKSQLDTLNERIKELEEK